MAELNFVVDQTALDTIKNTQLTANFAEMKEALTEFIAPYEKLIVSEDAIAEAKSDRARVNKIKGNIDSYRKLIKGLYNEPYKRFEDKCKELCQICDKGISNIDEQLISYEERRKHEKLSSLKDHYDNANKENPEYIAFSITLHPKWENKGTSLEECVKYMDDAILKADTEIRTIRNLHSQWETSLIHEYAGTHDLVAVLALNEQLTKRAELEAERKRREQEENERRQAELEAQREAEEEEEEEVPTIINLDDEVKRAISEDQGVPAEPVEEPIYVGNYKVQGTLKELTAVKRFLDANNITYSFKY